MVYKPVRVDQLEHLLQSVSLDRVKEHLRLLTSDEDALLIAYIEAATATLEKWTGYDLLKSTYDAYYPYCSLHHKHFLIEDRPLRTIDKVSVLQDDVLTELTTDDYTICKSTWETIVKINDDISIDTNDCEAVAIEYTTGIYDEISVTEIVTETILGDSPQIAKVTLSAAHKLKTFDQVILVDTGEELYNGLFAATLDTSTTFKIEYEGDPAPTVTTGTCEIPRIPSQLLLSITMMVAGMYANRGDCSDACGEIPCAVQPLAKSFRRYRVRTNSGRVYECCQ